jgi:hypothetical protein
MTQGVEQGHDVGLKYTSTISVDHMESWTHKPAPNDLLAQLHHFVSVPKQLGLPKQ